MSLSVLADAALYVTLVVGPLQLACVFGFFFFRNATVFAIRMPKIVLACMIMKLISFSLIAWLFLDPSCPCVVAAIMFWFDWTGNIANVLRKVILLFRYEIQDALEKSKLEGAIVTLDEKNMFVRYRQILRPRSQYLLLVLLLVYTAIPNIVSAAILHKEASEPCATHVMRENKLLLAIILISYVVFFLPMMVFSVWSTRRLKKFPHDNWKMGIESSYTTTMAVMAGIFCISIMIAVPTFDGLLFVLFSFSIVMQSLNFLMPLQLHRHTVNQLTHLDISKLTSLNRLLQNTDFLVGFDNFLRKEFSSENLYFWQSVHKMQIKYKCLLPEGMEADEANQSENTTADGNDVQQNVLRQAAEDCRGLGKQCIGDSAPWQVNISGFTGQDMEKAIRGVDELLVADQSEEHDHTLRIVVEDALKTLVVAQREVYEGLRKDSYPRFLMSAAAQELNNNENLKRLLAAEKLEGEVQKTQTFSKTRGTKSNSHSTSEKSSKTKDKQRLSYDVTLPQPNKSFVLAAARIMDDLGRESKSRYGGSSSEGSTDIESLDEPDVEIDMPLSVAISSSSSS